MNTRIKLCLRDVEFLFKPFRHRKLCLPTRLVLEAGNRDIYKEYISFRMFFV